MKRKSSKIIFREIKKMKILDINNLLKNQKENEIKKDIANSLYSQVSNNFGI